MNIIKVILVLFISGIILSLMPFPSVDFINHVLTHRVAYLSNEMTMQSVQQLENDMKSLLPGETLDVYINSPGGQIAALAQLLSIKKIFDVRINAIVVGQNLAASAAADFLNNADTLDIADSAIIVYHTGYTCDSTGVFCKRLMINDPDPMLAAVAQASLEEVKKALKRCIITKDEFDRVAAGQDVFITGAEANQNMEDCHPTLLTKLLDAL